MLLHSVSYEHMARAIRNKWSKGPKNTYLIVSLNYCIENFMGPVATHGHKPSRGINLRLSLQKNKSMRFDVAGWIFQTILT